MLKRSAGKVQAKVGRMLYSRIGYNITCWSWIKQIFLFFWRQGICGI